MYLLPPHIKSTMSYHIRFTVSSVEQRMHCPLDIIMSNELKQKKIAAFIYGIDIGIQLTDVKGTGRNSKYVQMNVVINPQ